MKRNKVLMILWVMLSLSGLDPLVAQLDLSYQTPVSEIMALADVTMPPQVLLSYSRDYGVLLYRDQFQSIADVSQAELRLAGLRIKPKSFSSSRLRTVCRLAVLDIVNGQERAVSGLPESPKLAYFTWSPDQRQMAFTHSGENGLELWVLNVETAQVTKLTEDCINGALESPFIWFQDGSALLVKIHPPDRQTLINAAEMVPTGPTVSANDGQKAQNMTFQDLLKNKNDEFNFEQAARSLLVKVELSGKRSAWLDAALYKDMEFSPDGKYVLISNIERPFSYIVPYHRFPLKYTLYDQKAAVVKIILEVPLLEVLPKGNMAERIGMRELAWRADRPASLFWVEALDGGDPEVEAKYRDELFTLDAPFTGKKRSLLKMHGRLAQVLWGTDQLALVYDYWWNTRNQKTYLVRPGQAQGKALKVFDRNYQDHYADPGQFVTHPNQYGRDVLEIQAGSLFLLGDGYSADGVRPFLDKFDAKNFKTIRLWQADGEANLEEIIDFRDVKRGLLLTRIQAKDQYPNLYLRRLDGTPPKALTQFTNPFASISSVKKEIITYKRDDGIDLSGTLYYPIDYEKGKRYPMLMWAYPQEFKDKGTAGQVTSSPHRFVYPYYGSPVFWVTRGYVVLDAAAFPIVGEGSDEPNDSFIGQLVANAKAAIDAVEGMGLIDRRKVAVGGHSYGAFMTANLLTHSDLFAAGIARSGAYNRSLTPFGFQNEERNFWEAQDVYTQMSPFMHAEKMKTPLLLIHGAADNNSGTHTMQSERYFNALKGLGATVRLVLLPHESHGYVARESVLHVLWEQDQWLEKYVKNRVFSE